MSKGTDKKRDTVQHMITRLALGEKMIQELISEKFESFSIVKKVYTTRRLSRPCRQLLAVL